MREARIHIGASPGSRAVLAQKYFYRHRVHSESTVHPHDFHRVDFPTWSLDRLRHAHYPHVSGHHSCAWRDRKPLAGRRRRGAGAALSRCAGAGRDRTAFPAVSARRDSCHLSRRIRSRRRTRRLHAGDEWRRRHRACLAGRRQGGLAANRAGTPSRCGRRGTPTRGGRPTSPIWREMWRASSTRLR